MKVEYFLNLLISLRVFLFFFFISEEFLFELVGVMSFFWIEIYDVVQCFGVFGFGYIRDVQVGIFRSQVVSDYQEDLFF